MLTRSHVALLLPLALIAATAASAHAALISVSGPNSSAGAAPAIVSAPANVLNDDVTNTAMRGFDEAQGVVTTTDFLIDGGTLLAGSFVDSHMIFLNTAGTGQLSHSGVVWTFSGPILGVMSNATGSYEAASSFELGAPGTNDATCPGAPPYMARGLEANDSYSVAGNMLTVNMIVTQPGDWIRVVTAAQVPEPGSMLLFGSGVAALLLRRRRR